MVYLAFGLGATALLFLISTVYFYLKYKRLKSQKKKKDMTQDATHLMRDLFNGGAITVTQIIDPDSIILQSPRDI